MSRFVFACMMSALICSTGLSQDSRPEKKAGKRGESRVQKKRGEQRSRENPRRTRTGPRQSDADRRVAFRKRLGELIEKGKLTREEASQLYTTAFPERSRGRETQKRYRNGRKVEVKDPAGFKTARGKALFSGPQPGEKIPAFKVTAINGTSVGKVFDPVSRAGGKPQVLIFMDENGVGIRGLFGTSSYLSQIADKSDKPLQLTAVLLGDDPAKLSQFGTRFGARLSNVVMGVSRDGRDGPGALGLNRTISMTVIVAKDGKVTHNFVFPQSMLYPDPHVLGAIASVIGEKRETVAKWLNTEQAEPAPARGSRKPAQRPSREEIIKRFDKDGDGKLSEEEGRAARKALQRK